MRGSITLAAAVCLVLSACSGGHDQVAERSPAVTITDQRIVIVPALARGYLTGTFTSDVDDVSTDLPQAVDQDGRVIDVRSDADPRITVTAGERTAYGEQPFGRGSDAHYVDIASVVPGDLVTVTFPFDSGDVTADFPVEEG